MKIGIYLISTICLCGFGMVNSFSHKQIRTPRAELVTTYQSPNSKLPSEVIKILAGEFSGLAADYLLLEVGSFLGSTQKGSPQDYHNIYLALKHALTLDPYFQQTYFFVQGNLPWEAKMPRKAIELLAISAEHRPWDWVPGQYRGFDYYYFFEDYANASKVFLDTARIPNAPPILADLGGRFALKSKRTAAAIVLLEGLLTDNNLASFTRKEIEDRVTALKGASILEKAIDAYRKRFNTYPTSLSELSDHHLLEQFPHNPYADQYFYDSTTGSVAFDEVK